MYHDFGDCIFIGIHDDVFCNCVKFLGQFGVAWVVRKLEDW